jgi:uncharacterized membrane protein YbhN (UPF0104 family)
VTLPDDAADEAVQRPSRRRTFVQVAFGVLAFAALAGATVSQWSKVSDTLHATSATGLVVATLLLAAGTFCSMLSWRAILADLGSTLSVPHSVAIFFLGQLGKYLPGSLWPVVAQMELGKAYRIPRRRSAVTAVVTIAYGLTSAGLVAAATLPWAATGSLRPYRYVFLVPVAGLVLLVPPVFNRIAAVGLRLLRRPPLGGGVSARGMAKALAYAVAQWLLWGASLWVLARAVPGAHGKVFAISTGAYALAWTAGFLFVIAPAGAGVREGALVLLLTPSIGSTAALGVSLLARLLTTVTDLFWGVTAFGMSRMHRSSR